MTNFDIWTRLNIIIRKDKEGGSMTPSEFEELLQWANIEKFKSEYGLYESSQAIKDALRFFLVKETISLTAGEYATASLTETYAHYSSSYYNDGTYNRKIDLVTDLEYMERMSSLLMAPTASHPIVNIYDDSGVPTFEFEPLTDEDVVITYLRIPSDPVFAYTLDADDNIVYNAGGSTELEWDDEEKINVIYLILQKLGVNLNEQEALQYGMIKENV